MVREKQPERISPVEGNRDMLPYEDFKREFIYDAIEYSIYDPLQEGTVLEIKDQQVILGKDLHRTDNSVLYEAYTASNPENKFIAKFSVSNPNLEKNCKEAYIHRVLSTGEVMDQEERDFLMDNITQKLKDWYRQRGRQFNNQSVMDFQRAVSSFKDNGEIPEDLKKNIPPALVKEYIELFSKGQTRPNPNIPSSFGEVLAFMQDSRGAKWYRVGTFMENIAEENKNRKPGEKINNLLELKNQLSATQKISAWTATAFALRKLHSRKISHRDVKPGNVIYDPKEKKSKLIDLGLAEKAGPTYGIDRVKGTPPYLSPELITGNAKNTRSSDIFALGTSLFTQFFGYEGLFNRGVYDDRFKGHASRTKSIFSPRFSFENKIKKEDSTAQKMLLQLIEQMTLPEEERISIDEVCHAMVKIYQEFQKEEAKQA
ncbi:protein kinase, partial [Patescibacteria group bacterium]|nr:protein kinase [Patescibacteria group bacterium]